MLVIDHLDAITDPGCLATLEHLLDRLPPHVRVVAVARRDPELGLARRRAAGTLAELRADELAFTALEVQAVLANRGRAELAAEDVELLRARTEGWPAAVVLAALWLERVPDPAAALQRFGGDHRFVVEYLSAEVLDRLEPEVRDFLLAAAVLGRFTPRLCDAVLDRDDSAAMLARLERENLFVVRHERGDWFRMHSLFADYARVQLVAAEPERAADLHRRASAWLRMEGMVIEAAEHAAAAGDHEALAELLDEHHLALIRSGRARTLLHWVRRLPEDVLVRHAALAAAAATAAAMVGQCALERRRLLQLADRGRTEHPGSGSADAEATVATVRAATVEPDVPRAVVAGARAAALADAGSDDAFVAAYGAFARALFFAGDLVAAWTAGMVAIEHPAAERRPPGQVFARSSLAFTAAERGHLGSARHHAEKARALVDHTHASRTWLGANAAAATGVVLAAEGRLEEAERELSHAEHFFRDEVATVHHAWLLLVRARVRVRRGRLDAAAADLRQAREEVDELGDCGVVEPLVQRAAAGARGRPRAGGGRRGRATAERRRAARAPPAAVGPLRERDRRGALPVAEHRPLPHEVDLSQAARELARRGGRAGGGAGAARGSRFTWVSGLPGAHRGADRCDLRLRAVARVHDRRRRRAERRGGHRLRGDDADARGRQHRPQRVGARPGGAPGRAAARVGPRSDPAQRAGRRVRVRPVAAPGSPR